MNDTTTSSNATAEPQVRFVMAPVEKVVPFEGLFDGRVTIDETSPALLLPCIVVKSGDCFMIIDGCKRFAALQKQGRKEVACGTIETPLDLRAAGLLRIGLNTHRQFHAREKLMFIGWLKAHFDEEAYREQVQKLRLPANERHEYERLLDCKPWLVEAVLQGSLDLVVAPEIDHLSENEALSLIGLFGSLSFSRQMQRELAEWLPEIAFLRKILLAELLETGPVAEVLADSRLNNPQKTAKVLDHAHTTRFPLFAETKKKWTEQARRINPDPARVAFLSSPYFEKDSIEIRIKADSAETAERIIKKLAAIDRDQWKRLIDPTSKPSA